MMSTVTLEPEILPEAFSNPCASYGGNSENFMMMDEVVKSCLSTHNSLYNNTGYFSENSFETESSHHSLILEDPVLGHSQEPQNANSNCSHQSNFQVGNNCVKLLQASDSFPADSDRAVGCHVNRTDVLDKGMHEGLGAVQVRIECADDEDSNGVNRTPKLNQDLLISTRWRRHSTLSSSSGSPTPTPSYRDLVSSPSTDYPGSEEKAFDVRGVEVAEWEEDGGTGTDDLMAGDGSGYHLNPSAKEECSVQEPTIPALLEKETFGDKENAVLSDVADSHIKSSRDVLPVVPKRRSHLSHLRLMQSPHNLLLPTLGPRKLSDPAVHLRRQKLKTSCEPKRQRCLSDSEAPSFPYPVDEEELKSEEGCSSALGCDSGFHDERIPRFHDSSPRVSLYSSDLHSLEDGNEAVQSQHHQRLRRVTPHPQELFTADSSQSDDQPPPSNPGTMVHPRERSRRSLLKHFSQGSIGGVSLGGGSIGGTSSIGASSESPSLSSLLETQSNMTCATDILSSLGFDDFDSPQLVPDRFIPKDLEFLRPSHMKAAFIEQILSPDPPRSPDSLTSGQSSNSLQTQPHKPHSVETSDLPLGATAENFMPTLSSPPTAVTEMSLLEVNKPTAPPKSADTMPLFTDTAISTFTRHRVLETVPEETASDLSLSPRWLSPRVSIDHSVLDLAEGKLGASLQKPRRRSLPTREGYKLSIGSLVDSDTGDSIHLSVTSYDDEIAAEREREREGFMVGIFDDITMGRRRRKGVYTPPQTLLSWLSTQKTIDEEVDTDPDELPWPFNEEARLRKSLTEISLAQQNTLTAEDELVHAELNSQREVSLSPPSSPLSLQPSLSGTDVEELNDLEVEGWLSRDQSHSGVTSHDRLLTISPDITPQYSEDAGVSIEADSGGLASTPASHRKDHLETSHSMRPRRAPISPLNASRCSLPHLGEGLRSLGVDQRKPPITDTLPQGLDSCSKVPDDPSTAESSQEEQGGVVSPATVANVVQPPVELEEEAVSSAVHTETSPKNFRSRKPRLGCILRQNSLDSQADNLPEDMSEIELLTGDLHSPMLSTRRSKGPFKRQENVEELSRSGSNRSRPSRRVAMIGEAPTTAELFASTNLSDSKSEIGKYMVL